MQKRKKNASTAITHSNSSQDQVIESKKESEGLILLVIFSFLTSFVGIFVKFISGMTTFQIIFFRASLALAFIFFIISLKKKINELRLEFPLQTIIMGLFEGISILTFFYALEFGSVSNAIFLAYTAPIWSVLISWLFLKEKIEKKTIISMLIVVVGVLFIVDPRKLTLGFQLGNLFAVLAGFFYAAMALVAKPILEKKSGYYTAFWQYLVIALIFGIISKFNLDGALENAPALIGLGVIATGISAIIFMEGIKKVKGQQIFIITSLEPLLATFLAFFLINEEVGVLTVFGGLLILMGIYNLSKK